MKILGRNFAYLFQCPPTHIGREKMSIGRRSEAERRAGGREREYASECVRQHVLLIDLLVIRT